MGKYQQLSDRLDQLALRVCELERLPDFPRCAECGGVLPGIWPVRKCVLFDSEVDKECRCKLHPPVLCDRNGTVLRDGDIVRYPGWDVDISFILDCGGSLCVPPGNGKLNLVSFIYRDCVLWKRY
jgi:hypothetical protein